MQLQVKGQWTQWVYYISKWFLYYILQYYILQNDFSWKFLLVFPINLVAFCLASTFDILPSSNNIWQILTDAAWRLCRKDVCTTAHILGICKATLMWNWRDANPNFRRKSSISMFKTKFQSQNIHFSIKIATSILKSRFLYWNCNFSHEIWISVFQSQFRY